MLTDKNQIDFILTQLNNKALSAKILANSTEYDDTFSAELDELNTILMEHDSCLFYKKDTNGFELRVLVSDVFHESTDHIAVWDRFSESFEATA